MREPRGSGEGRSRSRNRWLPRLRGRDGRTHGRRGAREPREPLIVCAANGCRFPAGGAATGDETVCPLCSAPVIVGELFAARLVYVSRCREPRRLSKREIRRMFRSFACLLVVALGGLVMWHWHGEIYAFVLDTGRAALPSGSQR